MFTTVLTTNNFPWEFHLLVFNGQRQLVEPYARLLLRVMRAQNVQFKAGQHSGYAVRPRLRVIGGRHVGQGSKRKAWHILMKLLLIKHAVQRGALKAIGRASRMLRNCESSHIPLCQRSISTDPRRHADDPRSDSLSGYRAQVENGGRKRLMGFDF